MPAAKKRQVRDRSLVLSEVHAKVVDGVASGMTATDAIAAAGMASDPGSQNSLMTRDDIKKALSAERRRNQYMLGMTRETILQGIKDAVDQAVLLADPVAQIMGWKEIGKICGFYAPEVKRIELSDGAKNYLQRMEQMSDDELLKLGESEVTDVEFEEIRR